MITYIEKQIETGDIKTDTGFIREELKHTRVILERLEMLMQRIIDVNRHVPISGEFYCLVLNVLIKA